MLKLVLREKGGGKVTLALGLTDVNLSRLQRGAPIRVAMSELPAEADGLEEVVIFAASRRALVKLAQATGLDERALLDQLGEG